jgi:uncharacterized repeat protein (TIGR01451 family)
LTTPERVSCNFGTVVAGDTEFVVLSVDTDPAAFVDNVIANTATVSSTTPDPVGANNSASETVLITPVSDLSVSKIDNPDPVSQGGNLDYTITVFNAGPNAAQNVLVNELFSPDVTVNSMTPSQGSCTVSPPVCNLGTLAAGASATVGVDVTVHSDAASPLRNGVRTRSDSRDFDLSNNEDVETTTVLPVTPL